MRFSTHTLVSKMHQTEYSIAFKSGEYGDNSRAPMKSGKCVLHQSSVPLALCAGAECYWKVHPLFPKNFCYQGKTPSSNIRFRYACWLIFMLYSLIYKNKWCFPTITYPTLNLYRLGLLAPFCNTRFRRFSWLISIIIAIVSWSNREQFLICEDKCLLSITCCPLKQFFTPMKSSAFVLYG